MDLIPAEEWRQMKEPARVAFLIRKVGPAVLGNYDGCICSRFSVRNVDVEISCGKGTERGIVVASRSMDYESEADFAQIVQALCETVSDHRGPIEVKVCKT